MELGTYINAASEQFEEIEDEELWQDGELDEKEVAWRIVNEVMNKGNWTLIRRKEE